MKKFSSGDRLEEAVKKLLHDISQDNPELFVDMDLPEITEDEALDVENSIDGMLAVVNGEIELYEPKPGGAWPVIKPCKQAIITVGGKEITSPVTVKCLAELSIQVKNTQPRSEFHLQLSADSTEVVMETTFEVGSKFILRDSPPRRILSIETDKAGTIETLPIDEGLVFGKLNAMGVTIGIDNIAIKVASNKLTSSKTVIARGKPMVQPVDGWIEYLFDDKVRQSTPDADSDKVDYLDHGAMNSVEEGQILAICHPPIPGVAGVTVTGQALEPAEPKAAQINAGVGAEIIDNGNAVIATITGRPVLSGRRTKVIKVNPELIIHSDVDIHTGHINFKGDVKILGSVTDGLQVSAGGCVTVMGSVLNARVYGDNGIVVMKNIIGSQVRAGGEAAHYRKVFPTIEKLYYGLQGVINAFEQLIKNNRFSTSDLQVKGEGVLIKLVLETRFPQVEKILHELVSITPLEETQHVDLSRVFQLMAQRLTGYGPLNINSITEIKHYEEFLAKSLEAIRDSLDNPADVQVEYCQQSHIEATGSVMVTGQGVFQSTIFAGKSVEVKGFCRGGEVFATEILTVAEIGSTRWILTLVGVSDQGKIKATKIYPNVNMSIGPLVQRNQNMLNRVIFAYDGEIIQKSF